MFERHFWIGLLTAALIGAAGTVSAREANGRQVHVVYEGQRLGSIAKRYNVSIEAICEANGIRRRDPIHPGQRLEIPSRNELGKPTAESKTSAPVAAVTLPPLAQADKQVPQANKQVAREEQPKASVNKTPPAPKGAESSAPLPKVPVSSKAVEVGGEVNKVPALSKVAEARLPGVPSEATSGWAVVDPQVLGANLAGTSHRIQAGESLSAIAVRYDTNVKTLLQINNLRQDQVIRVGQVLQIPRAKPAGTWWGKFARSPKSAGEIEVYAHTNRWRGKVIVNGRVQPSARAALSRLLGATGGAPPIPERLIQLLSHVSDTFGGRPVRLVSGYRTNSYVKDSRHRHSCAVDFSIQGVPNSAVRDYLLQLGSVGVGYYPNSTFVHLDVRARSAYWVDYAGPGEAPRKKPRADRRFARDTNKAKRRTPTPVRLRRAVSANVPAPVEPNAGT